MARKKKNRKKKNISLKKANMSEGALLSEAKKAEAAGNHVSAFNKYSKLIKKDTEKYKESYLNSCRNCFKAYLNKGAYNKAAEIVKSISSFSLSEGYSTRLILELNTNSVDKAAETAAKYLCEHYNSMELRDIDIVNICIDTMVISFLKPMDIKEALPELYDDIVSVQNGLQRVSKEDYNGARDSIKGINYSSPLSGWKMFIKGMVSYYQFDDNTAQKAFSKVKGSSILNEAAESYLALFNLKDSVNREYKNDVILSNICDLLNYEEAADTFPRSQYLFLSGRERDSYKHYMSQLRNKVLEYDDLYKDLCFFYYNRISNTDPQKFSGYIPLFKSFISNREENYSFDLYHSIKIDYINSLGLGSRIFIESSSYLTDIFFHVFGEKDKNIVKALMASRTADLLLEERRPSFEYLVLNRNKKFGSIDKEAEEFLIKAVELDQQNPEYMNKLIAFYKEYPSKKKERNKALETGVKRFPEDKTMLTEAGLGCLKRKAVNKAQKHFEKALSLDPGDEKIISYLVQIYFSLAKRYIHKNDLKKYQSVYDKAIVISSLDSDGFTVGSAYIYVTLAVFDLFMHRVEESKTLFSKAEKLCLNRNKLYYFRYLTAAVYDPPSNEHIKNFKNSVEEIENQLPGKYSLDFYSVWNYYKGLLKDTDNDLYNEEADRVSTALIKTAEKDDVTSQELEVICRNLVSDFSTRSLSFLKSIAKKMAKSEPEILFFRFLKTYTTILEKKGRHKGCKVTDDEEDELDYLVDEAESRGDKLIMDSIDSLFEAVDKEESIPEYDDPEDRIKGEGCYKEVQYKEVQEDGSGESSTQLDLFN